jgi:hypothetical protein
MNTPTPGRLAAGLLLGAALLLGGCHKDDFLNVDPKNALNEASAYGSETNADLVVNDIYNQVASSSNDSNQTTEQYSDNGFCAAGWQTAQTVVRAGAISPANVPTGPGGMWDWE